MCVSFRRDTILNTLSGIHFIDNFYPIKEKSGFLSRIYRKKLINLIKRYTAVSQILYLSAGSFFDKN